MLKFTWFSFITQVCNIMTNGLSCFLWEMCRSQMTFSWITFSFPWHISHHPICYESAKSHQILFRDPGKTLEILASFSMPFILFSTHSLLSLPNCSLTRCKEFAFFLSISDWLKLPSLQDVHWLLPPHHPWTFLTMCSPVKRITCYLDPQTSHIIWSCLLKLFALHYYYCQ